MKKLVFSAQAEVFPSYTDVGDCYTRFLRASGGVSTVRIGDRDYPVFSPRKRRCFHLCT